MRLLVVEDDPNDSLCLREILKQDEANGCELCVAEGFENGLEQLCRERADAVLFCFNINNPAAKGNFICFRQQEPDLPIIIYTAAEDEAVCLWALKHGAQECLCERDLTYRSVRRALQCAIERKRAEQLTDKLAEALPDTLFVKDAKDLRYVRINKAGEALIGIPREEILGKTDYDLFPREVAEAFIRNDREVLASRRTLEIIEETLEAGHLGLRTLRTRKVPVLDSAGTPLYLLGYSEDVTEKMGLEKSKQWLAALVEQSGDAIISTDLNAIIQTWNNGAEHLLGFSRDEAVGRSVEIYVPEDKIEEHKHVKACIARGESVGAMETHRRRKDGSLVDVLLSLSPICNAQGEVVGISAIIRDITDRKYSTQRLQQAYDDLERTQAQMIQMEKLATIGQFSAGIAHELKNPIAIMLQGLSFLERMPEKSSGVDAEVLAMMREAVQRSEKIINRLLVIGRPSDLELKPVDPKTLLQDALDLTIRTMPMKNIISRMEAFEAQQLPYIDEGLMQEALINLMTNAVHAMPEGGALTLRYGLAPPPLWDRLKTRFPVKQHKTASGCFIFEVADSGIGISCEAMDKLFTPFYTTKPKDQGTGLGLPLVQSIVQKHGGILDVESILGEGSCMRVCLPVDSEK